MNEIYLSSTKNLSNYDIETAIDKLLQQYDNLRKILIIPPDFTRCFSKAGDITQIIYKKLSTNVKIDIMPALGTHAMINDEERIKMYGDIPKANFLHHKWQSDTIKIGEVPKDFVAKISNNLFNDTIDVEVNKYFWEDDYDLILSIGQVVPHEVVGMANYSKNIFVGIGGRQMINKSHMLGAICGIEKALGNDYAPARQVFDYAQEHYLKNKPLVYILTVTTTNKDDTINLNGLYDSFIFCIFSSLSFGTIETTGYREWVSGFCDIQNCTFISHIIPRTNPLSYNTASKISRILGIVEAAPFVTNVHTPAIPFIKGIIKVIVSVISHPLSPRLVRLLGYFLDTFSIKLGYSFTFNAVYCIPSQTWNVSPSPYATRSPASFLYSYDSLHTFCASSSGNIICIVCGLSPYTL